MEIEILEVVPYHNIELQMARNYLSTTVQAAIIRDMFTKDLNLKSAEVQSALVVSLPRGEED